MILTPEQLAARSTARSFAQAQLAPHSAEWDRTATFPRDALSEMGKLGFLGMTVPPEWDGAGMDYISYALALEEIAAGDGAVSTIMSGHNSVGCMPLVKYGSVQQTGGTLAGVGMALKERNRNVTIGLADPKGAALYSYYTTGVLKAEGSSITEGIGQGRITKNLEGAPIDLAYQIPDQEGIPIIFDLLEHEGLCLGGSSGINVAGAIRLAKEMGPGHVIVTVLADYGTRYQSKLFNPEFLRSKKLPVPEWLERRMDIQVPLQ